MREKTVWSVRTDKRLAALAAVLCLSALLLGYRLGERSFRNPDEGRYAQVAREMLERKDWVEPTLYGLDYLKKPPLFYWLVAGSFKLFGYNEWAARLVPVLAGWLGVLAVVLFARAYFGSRTAIFAGLFLATNFWYVHVARYLVIDAVFSLFILTALLAFYGALETGNKAVFRALFYGSLAAAFLAKGPVAAALAVVALGAYALVSGRLKAVASEVWRGAAWGVPLFLALVLPWFIAVIRREPEFFGSFVWHEHVKRFLSGDFEHQRPWFYYLLVLAAMLLPWILFVRPLARCGALLRRTGPGAYLLVSCAAVLVFYSLSRSKMPTYIVPCLPLLAVVIAHGWDRWIDSKPVLGRPELAGAAVMAVVGIAGIVGVPMYLAARPGRYPAVVGTELQLLGAVLIAGTMVVVGSVRRNDPRRLFGALVGVMAMVSMVFIYPMETMNTLYSTRAFAEVLKPRLRPGDQVFIYDHPGPFYDFAFYLGRDVKVVGLEGEFEGEEGEHEAKLSSVSREEFGLALREGRPLYCLIRKSDFQAFGPELRGQLRVLGEDRRKVLFSSGGLP